MFGIGMPELIIILGIALVVIGPKKFPELLRSVGRGIADLKRATNDIKSTVEGEINKIAEETDLKEVKETLENDFGGIATSLNQSSFSDLSQSPDESLGKLADIIEGDAKSSETSSESDIEIEQSTLVQTSSNNSRLSEPPSTQTVKKIEDDRVVETDDIKEKKT